MNFKYTIFAALFAGGVGGIMAIAMANGWIKKLVQEGLAPESVLPHEAGDDTPTPPKVLLQGLLIIIASITMSVLLVDAFELSFAWVQLIIFFVGILLPAAIIDAKTYLLPNAITAMACLFGAGVAVSALQLPILSILSGALIAGGGSYVVNLGYRAVTGKTGIGMGDSKLLLSCGGVCGISGLPVLFSVTFALAACWILLRVIFCRNVRSYYIPLGPFVVAGTLIQTTFGDFVHRFLA